jgi:putative acyl-CoA dehydrogenase
LDGLCEVASHESNKPRHVAVNPWGKRVDEIVVSHEWKKLHRVAAEEGLLHLKLISITSLFLLAFLSLIPLSPSGIIALGYTATPSSPKRTPFSRLHQYAKLYLYAPASALVTCPLAMTDGACRLLEQVLKSKILSFWN